MEDMTRSLRQRLQTAWGHLPHPIRWVAVAVVGSLLVVVGIALLVLPGPGIPLIIVGLAVLGAEFAWARRTLDRVKSGGISLSQGVRDRLSRRERH
jgi:drug/metabolite transporter (DMT)-like permease